MQHDLTNIDGLQLHSNEQLRTHKHGNIDEGCQKPAVQQKTTDDDWYSAKVQKELGSIGERWAEKADW